MQILEKKRLIDGLKTSYNQILNDLNKFSTTCDLYIELLQNFNNKLLTTVAADEKVLLKNLDMMTDANIDTEFPKYFMFIKSFARNLQN
eukprot:Pgem_evm1s14728